MSERYKQSERLLERALNTIPLGTQTFSKSKTQFPYGVSPYFVKKGNGAKIWDVDNNEYIDFINGLLSISLGYRDPDVDQAVQNQLVNGVTFSLPHPLEIEVTEKIVKMVPCAEMVRFGKNGSDATSGAIRLARAYTQKEHIAVCGYHGWQDWYIASTTRSLGIPESTKSLTHKFIYNDLMSLEKIFTEFPNQIAAVILEPMNTAYPENNFLAKVKELAHANKAILIFDEMITGFRFAKGGAQEYFNVTPDLATFGKGVANGYPLSVLCGKKEIMQLLEEIFFSFTFGGETLSLAAALAVINKLEEEPVLETIFENGKYLIDGVNQLIIKHQMEDVLSITGHPSWSFLIFKDCNQYTQLQIKTLWMQEILAKGILSLGTHNISYAHNKKHIDYLLTVYDDVFKLIKNAIVNGNLESFLHCKPLQPLFKVR